MPMSLDQPITSHQLPLVLRAVRDGNRVLTADALGFLYLMPDGTKDATDNRFWNANDACCDFGKTGVDDDAYLMGLVDEISAKYAA